MSALVALVLFAGMLVFGSTLAASAATGDVAGASLSWGLKASWRSYVSGFGGTATTSGGASESPTPYGWGSSTGGTFDEATGAGEATFGGAVTWKVPAHGVTITLSNPDLVLTDSSTGTLSFDYSDSTGATGSTVFADLDLAGATSSSISGGIASFTDVPASAAQGTVDVFSGFYALGSALDPVSFSLPYEVAPPAPVAEVTTTTLTATPAAAIEGDTIGLSATVSPTASGYVQFFDGADAVGSPVAVDSAGSAVATTVATTGSHSYTAAFSAADPSAFENSTSAAAPVEVAAAPPVGVPVATTISVAASPVAPVTLGTATTLTATVASVPPVDPTISAAAAAAAVPVGGPTGTVEFFDLPAVASGTATALSLGSSEVSDGIATLPAKALTAGGHSFTATYTPRAGSAFTGSTATATANYGVVDTAVPTVTPPGADAKTVTGVTANWAYSLYSTEWQKSATGNISVDGQTFALSGGTAVADANGATVSFTGSLKVLAYPQFGGFWVTLTDPTLAIDSTGTGTWSATVTTSDAPDAAGSRLAVATIHGATYPAFGATGSATVALDFAGTTAAGTWAAAANVAYTNAWSNEFVLQVPASIRSFYYTSSASAAQANKPPLPLAVNWTVAAAPVDPSAGDLVWGFKDSWRAYLKAFGGTTSAAGGATVGADGLFTFGQAPAVGRAAAGADAQTIALATLTGAAASAAEYDPATGIGTVKYQGSVDFVNASHGFDIAFANPWVTFAADGSVTLSAETSTSDTAGLASMSRIDVATLAAQKPTTDADARLVWTNLAGTFARVLQPGGWDQYHGAATDPVSFSYGVNAAVEPVDPTAPTGPGTPTDPTAPAGPSTPVDPATPAAPVVAQQVCVAQTVSGATLNWGVKSSYVSYITGPIAKGSISTSGISSSDGFTWTGGTGTFNAVDSRGLISLSGSVHFTGHAGALDMTISNPRVQIQSATSAVLIVDMTSKALQGEGVNGAVTLANIDLGSSSSTITGSQARWVDASTTLTSSGAAAFGGFYAAGLALDPLTLTAPLGATTACDGYSAAAGSPGSLAETGANVTPLWGGLALLLAGMGILSLRRRARSAANVPTK